MSVASPRLVGRGDAVKGAAIDHRVVRVGEVGYSLVYPRVSAALHLSIAPELRARIRGGEGQ